MIKAVFSTVLIAILLSGCFSLTNQLPAYSTYSLNVKDEILSSKYFDISIKVNEPKALSSVNSKNIVYSKDEISQEVYALSKWSDRPSKLLQQNITKFLTIQNSYKRVSTSNLKVDNDFIINSEIQEFKHQFIDNNSYALFTIRVYLLDTNTQKITFKNFSYKKQLTKNNANNFVLNMNSLVFDFVTDLQNFIQETLSK